MKNAILFAAPVIVIAAGIAVVLLRRRPVRDAPSAPISTVTYRCDEGRSIDAAFFADPSGARPAPGEPPSPGGSARIELSDGRTLTLHQTVSADGVRYSDGDPAIEGDETVVFWSEGNGALVLERNVEHSYDGCIRIADDPGGLTRIYESGSRGFSMRYPAGSTVDTTYVYGALGPGREIHGVAFGVPDSLAAGTNLSSDSHLAVEQPPRTGDCTADRFLGPGATSADSTIDDTTVSVGHRTEAAAGNRYAETVFAYSGTSPCVGVRYMIHWTVLENWPEGAVQSFERQALVDLFDAMRRTLVLVR